MVSSLLQGAGPKLGQFAHVEANGDFRYGTPFLGKNIYREREREGDACFREVYSYNQIYITIHTDIHIYTYIIIYS